MIPNIPALSLWRGQTVHARYMPFEQRFTYRLFLIEVDIDRLSDADQQSALFSVNQPGLFSFYTKDHGAKKKAVPLRDWALAQFAKANVSLDGGSVRLVTFPRHLFYKFAPLSLWYGYSPAGELRGIIYEVNNTFGDTHSYVAAAHDGRNRHESDKNFHVSPFFDVSGRYRFTLRAPTDKLDVIVESLNDGARLHFANIKARRQFASTGTLLKTAFTMPFSTLLVTAGIHWEALKLWRRGAGYRSRPSPPSTESTLATAVPIRSNASTGTSPTKDAA